MSGLGPVQPERGAWQAAQDWLLLMESCLSLKRSAPNCSMGVRGTGGAARLPAPTVSSKAAGRMVLCFIAWFSSLDVGTLGVPVDAYEMARGGPTPLPRRFCQRTPLAGGWCGSL